MTRVWIFMVFIIGLWKRVSEASSCTTRGRFPNENEPDCRGYTMCLSGAPGIYTQYDLNCPENFIYSHIDNQCTNITSYQCYPQHNCTSEGHFVDDSKNCTTYIACIQGLNKIVTARLVECPEDTLYNPLEEDCVNSTTFTCAPTPSPPIVLDALPSRPSQEAGDSKTNNAVILCSKYVLLASFMFGLAI